MEAGRTTSRMAREEEKEEEKEEKEEEEARWLPPLILASVLLPSCAH
jgi:hypothetical protein